MKATYLGYRATNSFSSTVLAYLEQDPRIKPFISYFPTIPNFGQLIAEKEVTANREILTEVLTQQYSKLDTSEAVKKNIALLKEQTTFTITTGHQLNIFTGPLYFLYKIVTAVNLARELKNAYPKHNFVPVYWMASEDHDFAEINHTKIQGKTISWQREASGPTGKLSTASIADTVKEYQRILGVSANSEKLSSLIEEAYLNQDNLADATRKLVNSLFGEYGLVILDADDRRLKEQFCAAIEKDIIDRSSFHAINETSSALKKTGFHTQVNAREINFFYMTEGFRERIVFENGLYFVLNSDLKFSEEEIRAEIRKYPERFSPNVVMRPLYQESILPNLAYIGGGAELVYWLQLKENFGNHGRQFPILVLRNSALISDERFDGKLGRLDLKTEDIFKETAILKNEWVLEHSAHTLTLEAEREDLNSLFERLRTQAEKIDPTLGPATEAVKARLGRALSNLEKKLLKAERRNHSSALEQIENLRNKYFPGGSLQERSENFALFYVKYGDTFIAELIRHFKPLDFKFTILEPQV